MLFFLAEVLKTILLAQDLLCNFHLKSGVPKLCLKLDLANAFDSVKWGFLEAAFHSLSFHNISLPSSCVKKLSFSILINGQAVGTPRVLGNCDKCAHCLLTFTLVMEFFSAMMNTCVDSMLIPTPHTRSCMAITHVMFAGDLVVPSKCSATTAYNLKMFLDNFEKFSGWQ